MVRVVADIIAGPVTSLIPAVCGGEGRGLRWSISARRRVVGVVDYLSEREVNFSFLFSNRRDEAKRTVVEIYVSTRTHTSARESEKVNRGGQIMSLVLMLLLFKRDLSFWGERRRFATPRESRRR